MLKRSVIIKANKLKPIKKYKLDYKTLIFFTVFLCGLIIGVTIFKRSGEGFSDFITEILKNYLTVCAVSSIFKNFCSIFFILSLFIFVIFVFGLCAVGQFFIWLAGLFFGCMIGIVMSSYFCAFGILGVGYCALINIPCYAITAATLIKCCCESSRVSNDIFLFSLGSFNQAKGKNQLLKDYLLNYLIFLIPIIVAALLKSCFLKLFSGLFGLVG